MKPAPFDYHRPDSIAAATQLLGEFGDEAKLLAGGQSLVPMLSLRLAFFDHLIDISRLADLQGVDERADSVYVGAGTTEAAVEMHAGIASSVPLLSRATPYIGHFQIRNRGTVGGSIAHADPAGEYPAVALALDAELDCASTRGRRTIPAAEFFTGLWSTSMEPDEMLVGIRFSVWNGRHGFAVEEFARRHGDFAIAGAVVGVQLDGDDRVQRCAIGLLGLGSTPVRASAAESEVTGRPVGDIDPTDLGAQAMAGLDDVPSDLQGSAAYRQRVGAAMVARAWEAARDEARGETNHG
jgi:carbon-monoxide dehydrogenase medium subunit